MSRSVSLQAQAGGAAQAGTTAPQDDPVRALVGRLELEKYKATIKGLSQFGDRRQGTDRNRAANDWIETQLKSYGCSGVARITYEHAPAPRSTGAGEAGRPPGNEEAQARQRVCRPVVGAARTPSRGTAGRRA